MGFRGAFILQHGFFIQPALYGVCDSRTVEPVGVICGTMLYGTVPESPDTPSVANGTSDRAGASVLCSAEYARLRAKYQNSTITVIKCDKTPEQKGTLPGEYPLVENPGPSLTSPIGQILPAYLFLYRATRYADCDMTLIIASL